jgi:predicted HTH transcriptional regulator
VLNAIIHNDYIRGAFPVVEFYSDRVEITSSGGLPIGLSREDFFLGRSMPRSRELMRIFTDMELGEQLGSGMQRIMQSYVPDDFEISENFIVARFKYNAHALDVLGGQTSQKTSQIASQKTSQSLPKLNSTQEKILDAIDRDNTITTEALADIVGIARRNIAKNIQVLKEMGILKRIGGDRGGYWERLK